jgi:dihydrofolate reductase
MRKIIEYTLISIDGVVENPQLLGFMEYRDDSYMRDGLGLLMSCEAMLMGRRTYQGFAKTWPGRAHPWADRLNAIKKYVFTSTLESAEWNNSVLVRGDIAEEATKLKQQEGEDLLVFGHGLIGETLLKQNLLDVLDLSIHPVIVGSGKQFFRDGESAKLRLAATKTFTNIVKLTYEPQP